MAPISLPPGFRFHPTDEELVAYYLDRKINGQAIELEIIPEVNLYKHEPWELPGKSYLPGKDMEWYFFSPRDRKYPNGSRTNRATQAGYWKATGKDRMVQCHKQPVGMKKTLVYYQGRAPHGIRTNWVMHEYRSVSDTLSALKDAYALCRIFKKTNLAMKNKEEENASCSDKESPSVSSFHLLDDDTIEAREENYDLDYYKFPSDTSSSEVTQGTPIDNSTADDLHPPFASDEAMSCSSTYLLNLDSSSNPVKDITILMSCTGMPHQVPTYPPLALEDFPQMDTIEMRPSKPENIGEYIIYDKYRDCVNEANILEEIFCIPSSQDNPIHRPLYDNRTKILLLRSSNNQEPNNAGIVGRI